MSGSGWVVTAKVTDTGYNLFDTKTEVYLEDNKRWTRKLSEAFVWKYKECAKDKIPVIVKKGRVLKSMVDLRHVSYEEAIILDQENKQLDNKNKNRTKKKIEYPLSDSHWNNAGWTTNPYTTDSHEKIYYKVDLYKYTCYYSPEGIAEITKCNIGQTLTRLIFRGVINDEDTLKVILKSILFESEEKNI